MRSPFRVGVSPGTTSLVVGQPSSGPFTCLGCPPAGLGQVYLNPGSGPFPPCPPDPAVRFATDPWRSPTSFQPAGMRLTVAPPAPIFATRPTQLPVATVTVPSTRTGGAPTLGPKPTIGPNPKPPRLTRDLVVEVPYGTDSSLKGVGTSWGKVALLLGGTFVGGVGTALLLRRISRRAASTPALRGDDGSADDVEPIVDKTTHPSVVEYAMISVLKGKSPAAAAKQAVTKLAGRTNLFLGPGRVAIDADRLEEQLYKRMADSVVASIKQHPPRPDRDVSILGHIGRFFPRPGSAIPQRAYAQIHQHIVEQLGRDPFVEDPMQLAARKLKPLKKPLEGAGPDLMRQWQAIEGWEVSYSDMRYGGHDKVFVRSHPELRELTDRLDATGETYKIVEVKRDPKAKPFIPSPFRAARRR